MNDEVGVIKDLEVIAFVERSDLGICVRDDGVVDVAVERVDIE